MRTICQRAARRARAARRWLAVVAACGWLVTPVASSAESRPAQVDLRDADAVLVGSSSFNQAFGRLIERELERKGYQVARKGVSGAGLARPDYRDMNQVLEALPIGSSTAAVLVYLGVNDAQAVWLLPHERDAAGLTSVPFGTAEWNAVYVRRTRDFLDRICQRGARRALVLLPVDVNRPSMQRRLGRVRELQMQAAAESSCAVAVPTAGDEGQFEVAGVPKRMPDGYHMSARGAQIVWERIEPQVLALLEADAPR